MKNSFKKILSAVLAVLVLLISASVLLACNPEKSENERIEREKRERAESVSVIEDMFLAGLDKEWEGISAPSQIAALDNASEYVITSAWVGLVGDVLVNSSLQTAKLRTLADFMQSDDGKKLVADFNENAELILPFLKAVDFTPTDISNLVYDLLCALVTDSGKTFDAIKSSLEEVKAQPSITVDKSEKIGASIADMDAAKQNFVPTATERDAMLAAFENAKNPMNELVSFAYNISLGADSDSLFEALLSGGGALADISSSEIVTLVGTVRANFADLKSALEGDAVANLNEAFSLIIGKFDNSSVPSVIFAQILQYAKSAYMLVDVIPFLCDIAYSAGEIFDSEEFVGQLRECFKDGLNTNALAVNLSVIAAKALLKVNGSFTASQLSEVFATLANQCKGDYQKSLPLLSADLVLNMSNFFDIGDGENINPDDLLTAAHPDIIDKQTLKTMISAYIMISDNSYEKFRQAYNVWLEDNKAGTAAQNGSFSKLQSAASFFKSFKIANPFNEFTNTEAWGKYYLSEGLKAINNAIDDCIAKTVEDMNAFIEEFYDLNSESRKALQRVADMPLLSADITDEQFAEYMEDVKNSRIIGIIAILVSE